VTACACVAKHSPTAYVTASHHVLPKAWNGQTVPSNLVPLCPNSHTAVHKLLDAYVKAGGLPDWRLRQHYSAYVRALAGRAWAQRPAHPVITSLEHP